MWEIVGIFSVDFVNKDSGERVKGARFHFARFVDDNKGMETRTEFLSESKVQSLGYSLLDFKLGSKVFLSSNKYGKIDGLIFANS